MSDLQLTDLQLHIMDVLWSRPEATVLEVQEAMRPERDLAQSTVATLLARMEKKRLISHRVEGRQFVYRARVGANEVRMSVATGLSQLTRRLFAGDVASLVNHLLDKNDVSRDDLVRVRKLIEDKEQQLRGRKPGTRMMPVADHIAMETLAWLITFAIHSTILLTGAAIAVRFVRRESVRAVIWKTTLLGALASTTISWLPGLVSPAARITLAPAAGYDAPDPERGVIPNSGATARLRGSTPTQGAMRDPGRSATEVTSRSTDVIEPPDIADTGPVARVANEALAGAAQSTQLPRNLLPPVQHMATLTVAFWLAVALRRFALLLYRHRRLRLALSARTVATTPYLIDDFEQLRRAAGIPHLVHLTVSPACVAPTVLSVREVCVPGRFVAGLARDEQSAALAHEIAHIAHNDLCWSRFCAAIESLFFFQPLHVLARRGIRASSEILADEWAARHVGSRLALARCLMHVAEWIAHDRYQPAPAAVAMAESDSPLVVRVERLLTDQRLEFKPSPVRTTVASALVLALVAWSAPRITCDCERGNNSVGARNAATHADRSDATSLASAVRQEQLRASARE